MTDDTPTPIIRLLDSSGTVVMDSVSAEYEDSFSLETFEDLVEAHYESDPKGTKSFIIARVQTWDHKQPEKAFYSYYSAYQLNKILFQTQVYLGKKLIHRLHVLNPLTNTDIIGNVQYFMVKVRARDDTAKAGAKGVGGEKVNILATAVVEEGGEKRESGTGGRPSSAPSGGRKVGPLVIDTHLSAPMKVEHKEIVPPSPTVREIESGSVMSWTMAAPAVGTVTEEEHPSSGPGPQARKFSVITLGLKSPYPGSPRKGSPLKNGGGGDVEESVGLKDIKTGRGSTAQPPNLIITAPPRGRATSFSVGTGEPDTPFIPAPGPRRHSSQTPSLSTPVVTRPPPPMIQMRAGTKNNKKTIPIGTVTQFGISVPKDQLNKILPPTARSRRRVLSYVNAVTAAGTPASFEEWLEMVREEMKGRPGSTNVSPRRERKGSAVPEEVDAGDHYDTVKPFGTGMTPTTDAFPPPVGTNGRRRSGAMRTLGDMKGQPGTESGVGLLGKGLPMIRDISMQSMDTGKSDEEAGDVEGGMGRKEEIQHPPPITETSFENESLTTTTIPPVQQPTTQTPEIYDALLFATDNDFLESSRIRAIFREHAVTAEDAKLFEMPPYLGQEDPPPPMLVVDDSPICEWCYPTAATLERHGTAMRFFHRSKCYLLAVVVLVAMFCFIYFTLRSDKR
ncbi:hypothetical protein HDV00_005200 [Rhizophlyctis rosea]|nr:hypothetical protein HDV00_005200 [Rhizophlyctis rosea]